MAITELPVHDVAHLIVHDAERHVTTVRVVADEAEADVAYAQAEHDSGLSPHLDIVLVFAPDLATIERTHGSYFRGQRVVVEA